MRLGDLDALKKEVENLVVGGEKGLKDYYKNGSRSDQNAWIGGVYDAWELICNATTVAVNCKDCDGYEAGYSAGLKDAERPQGEWQRTGLDYFNNFYKCSLCGREILLSQGDNLLEEYPFCHCGADMRKGGAE